MTICLKCIDQICQCDKEKKEVKLDYSLLPIYAQQEVIKAFMDGINAGKYKAWDWLDNPYPYSEYYNKIRRHGDAWFGGEDVAEDSGVHHLAHLIADAMILLEWIKTGRGIDDRRKPNDIKGSGG